MSSFLTSGANRREFLATSAVMLAGTAALGETRMQRNDPPLAPHDKQPPHVKVPEPPKRKVGWAIVGLGQLTIEEVLPAFGECRLSKPVALVSGHLDKAKKIAATYDIDSKNIYDYENYDKIADNPAIDVIYIILPNTMHAEFTIRGLKAGKDVLCEKPMATSVTECQQMISAAQTARRKLMIAYRLRYEPFNMSAIDRCRSGELGRLKTISSNNCQNVEAPNIRLSKSLGGGPLQDVGIYCLNACRYLTGEEPIEVYGSAHSPSDDPRFREVPESVTFSLKFPSGVLANGLCSFGTERSNSYSIQGTGGCLDMQSAFFYAGQQLVVTKAKEAVEAKLKPVNHFAAEMDHFSECILENKAPRTPGEEGLADIQVIAAIEESIRSGRSVKVTRA